MAVCWSCSSALSDGVRWCPICHANQVDPTAGRLASPGKRLGAFALDGLIAIVVVIVVVVAAVAAFAASGGPDTMQAMVDAANSASPDSGATGMMATDAGASLAVGFGVAAIALLGYLILNLYFYAQGTTPGKKMLGMRVIKEDGTTAGLGTMILREWIGKLISQLIMLLGFIWILIDGNRQGWHDKLVSTYVVE